MKWDGSESGFQRLVGEIGLKMGLGPGCPGMAAENLDKKGRKEGFFGQVLDKFGTFGQARSSVRPLNKGKTAEAVQKSKIFSGNIYPLYF